MSYFFQVNETREKYFGWILDNKYDLEDLQHGFESLKGRDQAIGKYLDLANKSLPGDKHYDFYVVRFEKRISVIGRKSRKYGSKFRGM